jgi:hypothetical protein
MVLRAPRHKYCCHPLFEWLLSEQDRGRETARIRLYSVVTAIRAEAGKSWILSWCRGQQSARYAQPILFYSKSSGA